MAALATDLRERPQDMAEWMAMLGAASESVPAFEANGAIGDPPGDGAEDETADVGLSGVDGQPDVVLTEASGKAVLARKSGRGAFPGWLWGAMAAVVVVAVGLTLWLRGGNAEQDEAALGLSVEDRVLVQRGLVEVGHDPGESDGLFGEGTREGLRTWQESRGLEATGFLTAPRCRCPPKGGCACRLPAAGRGPCAGRGRFCPTGRGCSAGVHCRSCGSGRGGARAQGGRGGRSRRSRVKTSNSRSTARDAIEEAGHRGRPQERRHRQSASQYI